MSGRLCFKSITYAGKPLKNERFRGTVLVGSCRVFLLNMRGSFPENSVGSGGVPPVKLELPATRGAPNLFLI